MTDRPWAQDAWLCNGGGPLLSRAGSPSVPGLGKRTHTCMHTYPHMHTRTRTHAHTRTCTCIFTHLHAYAHTHMHAHAHACAYTHTYAHMHTCTHAYSHTCTHMHTRTCTHTCNQHTQSITYSLPLCVCPPSQRWHPARCASFGPARSRLERGPLSVRGRSERPGRCRNAHSQLDAPREVMTWVPRRRALHLCPGPEAGTAGEACRLPSLGFLVCTWQARGAPSQGRGDGRVQSALLGPVPGLHCSRNRMRPLATELLTGPLNSKPHVHVCSDAGDPTVCQQADGQTAVKREETLTHATMRVTSEDVTLSETSQTRKDEPCRMPLLRGFWRSHIHRDSERVLPVAAEGVGSHRLPGQSVRVRMTKPWR